MATAFSNFPFNNIVSSIGSTISIHGSGFTGASTVSINGTSATFTVVSDTLISAIVPADATTGPISVTAPGGTATTTMNIQIATPACQITSLPLIPNLTLSGFAGGNSNLLLWNITGTYDIYRGTSSGTETLLDSGITTSYYFDNAALNGTSYCYYIKQGSITSNEICGIDPYDCGTCTLPPSMTATFCCPILSCCSTCTVPGSCAACSGFAVTTVLNCTGGQFTLRANFISEGAQHDTCVLYGTCSPLFLMGVFTNLCVGGTAVVVTA